MNTSIRCRLATKKMPLVSGQKAKYEELAPMANRSLIEVQALMRKANISMVTFDSKAAELFCGIGGGIIMCDDYLSMTNLQITHVYGEPVSAASLGSLAYRIGAPFVDITELRKMAYQIANGSGSQLANISKLAAMTAPAMLVLGDDASTYCLDVTSDSFANDKQTRHYVQHLELWMNTILEEQGVTDATELVAPWIERIAGHLSVDLSAPQKNHSLNVR